MKSIIFPIFFLLIFSEAINAQCTYTIPANTVIISNDTVIDCSFIPGTNFLVCSGASLSMTGNSTCINHFYMEDASVVTFKDSLPGAPYGLFSFFIKGIAILDFNDDSPISFGIIDTLVYEPSALLIDTGSIFQYIHICQPVIFDYSQLPSGTPCVPTEVNGTKKQNDFAISPMPFSNELFIETATGVQPATVKIFDLTGRVLEVFEISGVGRQQLSMKNTWTGAGFIQLFQNGKMVSRKMITRSN